MPVNSAIIVLGDSSLLVTYLGSDLHDTLLIPVCRAETWNLVVPHKVGEELARRLPQISQKALRNWKWLVSNNYVEILGKVAVGQGSQEVLKTATTLLQVKLSDMAAIMKNEGEAFVVAHAREIAESGGQVKVAIDDSGGKIWAGVANLAVITSYDILDLAIEHGIVDNIPSLNRHYNSLQVRGHLAPLGSTGLEARCHAKHGR